MGRVHLRVACFALAAACSRESGSTGSWPRELAGVGFYEGRSVATDASGNVYFAAYAWGPLDGTPGHAPVTGPGTLVLASYTPSGDERWSRRLGATGSDALLSVAIDPAGDVYAAGMTYGSVDGYPGSGTGDPFLAKYDASGAALWIRQLRSPEFDSWTTAATDAERNVVVAGVIDDGNGNVDAVVAKYDSSGALLWKVRVGTPSWDQAFSVATDATGNVWVAGTTFGGLDGNASAGESDAFVVKLDAQGVKAWTLQLGTSNYDDGWSIATDAAGNAYLAGATYGPLFVPAGDPAANAPDAFLAKIDARGGLLWGLQSGAFLVDHAYAVAVDAAGDVYVAGIVQPYDPARNWMPATDVRLAKYGANGVPRWTRTFGAADPVHDYAYSVAVDRDGHVYVAGRREREIAPNTFRVEAFVASLDAEGRSR